MKSPDRQFIEHFKPIIRQMPGMQKLNKIRHGILRIRELSDLIREGRTVVLHPYAKMNMGNVLTHEIVHDVVKDFLQVYGTVRQRQATAVTIGGSSGTILLYAPLALLRIPASHENYLEEVGGKTRNVIRKADRYGYEFKEFVWNEHLGEIYEINTSKEVRQSEPMRGWYREPVQRRDYCEEALEYRKYYGAFKDGRLCAYLHVVLCGDFGFFRHYIGHAAHLTYGVMNGLLSWTVGKYVGNSQICWLNYGELSKEPSTMHQFRKSAGFQGYATLLDLGGDEELLGYAEKRVRTIWCL